MTAVPDPGSFPEAGPVTLPGGTVLRPFGERAELEACVALQRRVWGEDFADVAPPAILQIAPKVGGVSAGAFGGGGELLGFVFGLTGIREGRPAHWSHMLAVAPEARGRDLGYHLKLYQRRLLLSQGVETARWTYDPLVSKNAYLNLARLGARAVRYERDYYGEGRDSALSAGIGTDRFVVEWRIAEERVAELLERNEPEPLAAELRAAPMASSGEGELPEAPAVRVEVPADVQEVRRRSPEEASRWRASTRRAFEGLLGRGYGVVGFYREPEPGQGALKRPVSAPAGEGGGSGRPRSFYVLAKETG